MANRNYLSGGKIYSGHKDSVKIDLNFIVDDTQVRGISSLKGPYVSAVYMNSAHATPASPNPAAGTIVIRLQDNFSGLITGVRGMPQSPLSGSDVKIDNSAMTAGVAYVITTLGDASRAKWTAIGVPAGVVPAVGVSFVALSNGGTGNALTSRVQATATNGSLVASMELVGNPNLDLAPQPSVNQGYGGQIIVQCYDYAGAKVAPAAGSKIFIELMLANSSVQLGGES